MAEKNLLSAAKIAKALNVSPTLVKNFINNNKIKPELKRGNCVYYGEKSVKLMEKEFFLSTGNIAKTFDLSPSKVKNFIKVNNIEPDRKKGNCTYFGPKSVAAIKKGVK